MDQRSRPLTSPFGPTPRTGPVPRARSCSGGPLTDLNAVCVGSAQPASMKPLRLRLLLAALAALAASAARAQPAPQPFTPQERAAIVQALRADCEPSASAAAQMDDPALTRAVRQKAVADLGQRLDPSEVDRFWAYDPPRHDVAAEIAAARSAGRLGDWLKSLA